MIELYNNAPGVERIPNTHNEGDSPCSLDAEQVYHAFVVLQN